MKKKLALIAAVILLQIHSVDGQPNAADSLKNLLRTETRDTSRISLLNQLSKLYILNYPDTALLFSQQALELAKKTGLVEEEAMSLLRIGNAFSITGNFSKALELDLESLKKAESIGNEQIILMVLSNIGVEYGVMGNYRESITYTLKTLDLARRFDHKEGILTSLLNLGDSYEKLNILDSARIYTIQAYNLSVQPGRGDLLTGLTLNNLGNIYSKMGQNAVAIANYNLAIPILIRNDNLDVLCETYLGLAKVFRKTEIADSAFYYAKLSLEYGKKGGFQTRVMDASNFLTGYYISIQNVDSAFVYQSATIAAKDSIFSQERQKTIQRLTFDETMRQQNIALATAKQEKQRKDNIQVGLIAIAIVVFIILFLMLSRTVIVNDKWIRFLGMMGLLLFFEFLNLFLSPYISKITFHTPLFTLLAMVLIAFFLIPVHHRLELWIKEKVVVKNKKIRLAAAKRTVAQLEQEEENLNSNK